LIILGIDPGLATVGYGVISYDGKNSKVIDFGVIQTPKEDNVAVRLAMIDKASEQLITKFKPDAIAIEELFFNTNTKTAIMVGQARGVALLACANSGLPVYEFTPLQIKQGLVGYGRAEKKQVQMMVKTILGLSSVPKPDDTADALAAAICCGHSANSRDRLKNKL